MAEPMHAAAGRLRARPALGERGEAIELHELDGRALVTVVLPYGPGGRAAGEDEPVRALLASRFGCALPRLGESVLTERGERLLGLQQDRLYVMFEVDTDVDPERLLHERLRGGRRDGEGADGHGDDDGDSDDDAPTLYLNDQSDSWVMLRMAGAGVRAALERSCPLDLHHEAYPVGAVARTVMEHIGTIVLREGPDAFVLLAPRSSAEDVVHELETSIRHTAAPR